ncbi:hypothetical protein [Streptomyces sp. NPDC046860]|uniref:hypothetical protein n=1 Tax=Streptomyces sp. NPDC046860 TaxID=3154495 RepID=UPI003408744E
MRSSTGNRPRADRPRAVRPDADSSRADSSRADSSGAGGEDSAPAGPGRDLPPLLAGAATGIAACGALLALTDSGSPLRGPCALLFLLAAPALAIARALRGLDLFGRVITALAGAVALDMLVAETLLSVHQWSVTGGIVAVAVLSLLILLATGVRERAGRARGRAGPGERPSEGVKQAKVS